MPEFIKRNYVYVCDGFERECYHTETDKDEPNTNADRIRAMSDEGLAKWIAKTQIANVAEALNIAHIPWEQQPGLQELTEKECLEWLQQPAEV